MTYFPEELQTLTDEAHRTWVIWRGERRVWYGAIRKSIGTTGWLRQPQSRKALMEDIAEAVKGWASSIRLSNHAQMGLASQVEP